MDRQEIASKLKEIIRPYVPEPELFDSIQESSDILKDLKVNSAHLVDIILDAEEVFDIEIDDESAERMLTVASAIDVIENLLNR